MKPNPCSAGLTETEIFQALFRQLEHLLCTLTSLHLFWNSLELIQGYMLRGRASASVRTETSLWGDRTLPSVYSGWGSWVLGRSNLPPLILKVLSPVLFLSRIWWWHQWGTGNPAMLWPCRKGRPSCSLSRRRQSFSPILGKMPTAW